MASWNKVAKFKVQYDLNEYKKKDDGTREFVKTTQKTENVSILGNTTAVHFFGEDWKEWVNLEKGGTIPIPAGKTTVREKQGDGSYKYNSKDREAYDRAAPITNKRIGAGKKVTLYTGAYGTKATNNTVWIPKTVTFQFPAWLKIRDILTAVRLLCNEKIADKGVPKADQLHPYCRINGVRYPIPTSAVATANTKISKAENAALQTANDNSEKGKTA